MRKMVELCYDSLVQAFLFFVEWTGLVILASRNTVSSDWGRDKLRHAQSQLVDNLPAIRHVSRKD